MPSGRVHFRIESVLLAAWLALGGYLWNRGLVEGWWIGAFAIGYLLSMHFLSPDLDLSSSRAFRRWGILRLLWWPYAKLFRHRRSSHHWLWGTTTRLAYVLVVILFAGFVILWATGGTLRVGRLPRWPTFVAAAMGLYVPNLIHILADAVGTFFKRLRR
jgi:uncharacterized metal-binding protein